MVSRIVHDVELVEPPTENPAAAPTLRSQVPDLGILLTPTPDPARTPTPDSTSPRR